MAHLYSRSATACCRAIRNQASWHWLGGHVASRPGDWRLITRSPVGLGYPAWRLVARLIDRLNRRSASFTPPMRCRDRLYRHHANDTGISGAATEIHVGVHTAKLPLSVTAEKMCRCWSAASNGSINQSINQSITSSKAGFKQKTSKDAKRRQKTSVIVWAVHFN